MKYITTTLLTFMTVVLIASGLLLWKRRKETGDHSRTIQATLSWISAFFTFAFIFRTWAGTTAPDSTYFAPEHIFVPILCQMTFFFYPLEVIHPTNGRTKVYTLLFTPLLLLVLTGMCTGIKYTTIYTYADLWQHIGEFNVWFRLLALTIMLFYCFSLFLVPYDWRESSADRNFIIKYALGFCLIGMLHFAILVTHAHWLLLMHQIAWITLFLYVAYYELHERLQVPQTTTKAAMETDAAPTNDRLWEQITVMLDSNGKWRSPELSLTSLAEQLESNRTYVGESFKHNTGMTFVEYITHRRIDYVVKTLKRDPDTNLHELFNYVGYRQRSTAYRNFQKTTGMSPTEFLESIRH